MKGEYKVPGGKLVVVEADERNGTLVNVRVSGDFFLEPDEALDSMTAAIEGLSVTADAGEIARRVRDALPADVVMLGFHPEAVATAVRRAIAHARSFTEYTWDYLPPVPMTAAEHMALDQVLAEELGAGRRGREPRVRACQRRGGDSDKGRHAHARGHDADPRRDNVPEQGAGRWQDDLR
jgi:lipoate-protein ligase A